MHIKTIKGCNLFSRVHSHCFIRIIKNVKFTRVPLDMSISGNQKVDALFKEAIALPFSSLTHHYNKIIANINQRRICV